MNIPEKLDALRTLMAQSQIDAVIIPHTDPHQSEYIADHWQVRRYLSGFTGSAGTLVVTHDKALLWTDSRYFIQAAQQLDGTPILLMKDGLPTTPSINDYLAAKLQAGARIGIDGMLLSVLGAEAMEAKLGANSLTLVTDFDVIDQIWTERPLLPKDKIFIHDEKYAGESAVSKLASIRSQVKADGAESVFISALDEIAWALNIRCNDVQYNPVATAYLYIGPNTATLLIDPDKVDAKTAQYLKANGVDIQPYSEVKHFISTLGSDKVLIEPKSTSITLRSLLGNSAVYGASPIAYPKACKNTIQMQGIRNAMVRDGVALVKAHIEIEETLARGEKLTEMDVAAILLKYRSQQPLFFDESFGTIAGYGAHGAIVHYEADEDTNATLQPHGLLLIDSGAQYLDGTTDITRTIALGQPTAQEKHDFTLVMKGNIALSRMIFPVGTYGVQLDAEARKYLWREGLTYLHGTGHGVGHFLNVHEGPHQIRLNYIPATIREGMVTSNEPGLYRENIHGIRCENLELCVKAMTTEFGDFLKFETLTLFPFDLKLFETQIMTDDEIAWLNEYHYNVRQKLSPYLDSKERAWLEKNTAPLSK